MPRKYNIHVTKTDPRFPPIGKYATLEFREDCAGSCRQCVKKKCVYNIFNENFQHWNNMESPDFLYICKSCYRCVEECTKGIFSLAVNPEYSSLGDDYWTPGIISTTWAQAHTGAVPVSGAGYRGPFTGEGFDSIWTDISEIVRPTRDGIHGREYINTTVELSRRPTRLRFDTQGSLLTEASPILEIPVPLLMQQPEFGILSENELLAMAAAAAATGTMLLIKPESYRESFDRYASNLIPCLSAMNLEQYSSLVQKSRMIEIAYAPGIKNKIAELRSAKADLFIAIGVPLNKNSLRIALELSDYDIDVIHCYGSEQGREMCFDKPRYLKDLIREIHLALVDAGRRQKLNLVFSGGIALAEHMAKAIICGADAVTIDVALLVALECRLCYRCKKEKPCPVEIGNVELQWASQRVINLLGAWYNQLLEVMGACGIREARRMRGETGRSMWFEDMERDSFSPLFGTRKVSGTG